LLIWIWEAAQAFWVFQESLNRNSSRLLTSLDFLLDFYLDCLRKWACVIVNKKNRTLSSDKTWNTLALCLSTVTDSYPYYAASQFFPQYLAPLEYNLESDTWEETLTVPLSTSFQTERWLAAEYFYKDIVGRIAADSKKILIWWLFFYLFIFISDVVHFMYQYKIFICM
jgi:hypothetical protein